MTLRQLPGVALLGLLAALLAHTAGYGDSHEAGGPYHQAIVLLALCGAGGFVAALGALTWSGARRCADGSILAAAMRPLIPSMPAIVASAALWFTAIEHMEPAHADAPSLLIALCIVAAGAFISIVARRLLHAVAAIVLAIAVRPFARRAPQYRRRFEQLSSVRRIEFVYRRSGRAPPIVTLLPL
ncbi:MAG TPA: hypothetical protein VMA98_01550 [Candidatus Acidoferrales bacterium]|nr:hypothetical protein [Candidatus Acidoferrales bacterium]